MQAASISLSAFQKFEHTVDLIEYIYHTLKHGRAINRTGCFFHRFVTEPDRIHIQVGKISELSNFTPKFTQG
jgi:hypothetical protein